MTMIPSGSENPSPGGGDAAAGSAIAYESTPLHESISIVGFRRGGNDVCFYGRGCSRPAGWSNTMDLVLVLIILLLLLGGGGGLWWGFGAGWGIGPIGLIVLVVIVVLLLGGYRGRRGPPL